MEPNKKAIELFNRMYKYQLDKKNPVSWGLAKKQSLIAVDEIINTVPFKNHEIKMQFENTSREPDWLFQTYWELVKSEIEKL